MELQRTEEGWQLTSGEGIGRNFYLRPDGERWTVEEFQSSDSGEGNDYVRSHDCDGLQEALQAAFDSVEALIHPPTQGEPEKRRGSYRR